MRRISIAACCAALLVAGCGGGGEDEARQSDLPQADQNQIRQVTDQLIAAAREKDGPGICSVLQPSLIDKAFGNKAKCAKSLAGNTRSNAVLESLEIASFEQTDTGASVTFQQDPPGVVAFVEENGSWYIDLSSLAATGSSPDSSVSQ